MRKMHAIGKRRFSGLQEAVFKHQIGLKTNQNGRKQLLF